MARALRTPPAGAVDFRCSASKTPTPVAESTIFHDVGRPRRRGWPDKPISGWVLSAQPDKTLAEGFVLERHTLMVPESTGKVQHQSHLAHSALTDPKDNLVRPPNSEPFLR